MGCTVPKEMVANTTSNQCCEHPSTDLCKGDYLRGSWGWPMSQPVGSIAKEGSLRLGISKGCRHVEATVVLEETNHGQFRVKS